MDWNVRGEGAAVSGRVPGQGPYGVIFAALRYYWTSTKGYRLRPWASPYIRWRLETFFGGDMRALGPAEFFRLLRRERKQLARFVVWAAERRRVQSGDPE